ncbi:MAG: CoB--CoM heterodisulfide reductase iron-sulfur subunit B family protein [Anaerolineae bacterium]|nr:CoB--CoM heterodisulfide reductase iron-sulfur subunit B family protein [Anaerolineae bacterium]
MAELKYAYYPGCSLFSTAKEYDVSLRAVFAHLGIVLHELEDWSCCGAVHADVNNADAAYTLPGRNLALAEAQGFSTIIAPCSACYKNLRRVSKAVAADRVMRNVVNASLSEGLELKGNVTVLHPLYALLRDYGLDAIKAQVVRPLSGLKVASYYGCMLTRPRDEFDSTEHPVGLEQLMGVLGAELIDYPMKAKCCGGALALSHGDVTARLTGDVLVSAKARGAEVVTLACPMCHMALDMYQSKAEQVVGTSFDLPVLFFTQLLGLALGIDRTRLDLERHLVSTEPVITRVL